MGELGGRRGYGTTAAATAGLQRLVVGATTAAVDDKAEHTGALQQAVPFPLLLTQLARSLFQAVTIFREKMAHIDDSLELWNTKDRKRDYNEI